MATRTRKTSKVQGAQGQATPREIPAEGKDRATAYTKWVERVARAQKAREAHEKKFRVEELENYFLGKQADEDSDDAVVLNHFCASIETDLPNLFYQQPKWFIRPTARSAPGVELRARKLEATLDLIAAQDQNLKRAGRLAVLQSFFRCGVLEAVYDPRLVPNPEAGEPIYQTGPDGETLFYPAEVPGEPMLDPMSGQMVPGPPTPHPMAGQPVPLTGPDGAPQVQPDTILSDETFRFEWIDAACLLLDDEAGPDPKKHRWIGKEVVQPVEVARQDEKFNKNRRLLVASEVSRRRTLSAERTPTQDRAILSDGYVRLYVCYDLEEREQVIFADAQPFQDFLYKGPITPGLEDHPFSVLGYQWITGPVPSAWPKPPTYDWLCPQHDYNMARYLVREHAERILPKEVYDDSTFASDDEITKYVSPMTGGLSRVQNTNRPPVPVQQPPMNEALLRSIPMLLADWRIITGQTGARMGSSSGDTATEAALVERNANLRDSAKQDAINDWLSLAGVKMTKLIRKNMTFNLWVKLRGHSKQDVDQWLMSRGFNPAVIRSQPQVYDLILQVLGEERWDQVSQEDLNFDADILVVPGSARARNLEVERKQWVDFLALIGQAPQLAMSRELLRTTAEKFETVNERMVDEIYAMSQQMLQAKQAVAGHAGTGDNGGNPAQPGVPAGAGGMPTGGPLAAILGQAQAVTGRSV